MHRHHGEVRDQAAKRHPLCLIRVLRCRLILTSCKPLGFVICKFHHLLTIVIKEHFQCIDTMVKYETKPRSGTPLLNQGVGATKVLFSCVHGQPCLLAQEVSVSYFCECLQPCAREGFVFHFYEYLQLCT